MNRTEEQVELMVSKTIHEAIVNFDPESRESYDLQSMNIKSLEEHVKGVKSQELRNSLLSRIRACGIGMAHEAGRSDDVIMRSESFFSVSSPSDPDFVSVALFRVLALHQLGRHEEEVGSAITLARGGIMSGESLTLMLERLIRDHPGVLCCDEMIADRIEEFIDQESCLLIEGVERPVQATSIEASVLVVACAIRERNRALTEKYLLEGRDDPESL